MGTPLAAARPSGRQFAIAHGDFEAVVTQVGATLRRCTVGGVDVIDGFDADQRASGGRGQVLPPWPNRLAAGRYSFGGYDCQVPLNEPGRGNSIHGLVRWLEWTPVVHTSSAVPLRCTLHPQPGYEWELDLEVTHRLGVEGLTVSTVVVNRALQEAPFGIGFHPYLTVGTARVDDVELALPARSLLSVGDPDVEPSVVPLSGTGFSQPGRIGPTLLDTAYTDLLRDADGRAVATVRDPHSGRRVDLWVDEQYRYLMVCTGDDLADPARRRRSVALEPMTCPPHALRHGVDVIRLQPSEPWQASWGLQAS